MTTNETPPPGDAGAGGFGSTDDSAPPPPPPRPSGNGFFDSVRRIGVTRSDDRWVGGVAAGVADRFRLDPLLVRGLLILSFFVAGVGLVIYGVAWALLPERSDGRIHLQEAIRGTYDIALMGATASVVAGIVFGGGFWPWWAGPAEWVAVLLWIAFWVAVVWLIVKLVRTRGRPGAQAPHQGTTAAPTYPAYAPPSDTPPSDTPPGAATSPAEPFTPAPQAHYAPAAPPVGGTTATMPTGTAPMPAAPHMPPAPAAPLPPRPRRSVGGGTVGVVLGLVLLAGAALLVADRAELIDAATWPVWVGITVVVLGVGIVVGGLRGLRGGWLTFFAWCGLVATLFVWPFAGQAQPWPWQNTQLTTMSGTAISGGEVTPRSLEAAEEGFRVQFGDARVDLTALDLSDVRPGQPVVVPIDMTAGRAVVEIPADTAVAISADVNAGNLVVDIDDERSTTSGFTGGPADYQTDEVDEVGGAVLQLDIDARAGEIVIEEER